MGGKPITGKRRTVLKSMGALAGSGLIAGCGSGNGDGGDGGGGGGGGDGSGTTTAANTPSGDAEAPTADDPEAWRAEMANKAEEELQDDALQVLVEPSGLDLIRNLYNGYDVESAPGNDDPIQDGSVYEVLRDKIELLPLTSSDQVNKYTREKSAGISRTDVLFSNHIPTMVQEDVPFLDHSQIPGWEEKTPQNLKDFTNEVAWSRAIVTGGVYNPNNVPNPPENILDFVSEDYRGMVTIDPTPAAVNYVPFLAKYRDSVPPHLESLGSDMTGLEFVEALADNDPVLEGSSYTMTRSVGDGTYDIGWMASISSSYEFNQEGLNIEFFDHPSAYNLRASPSAVAAEPPRPAAAKLFMDYLLSTPKVQIGRLGTMSIDFERSNPDGLKDFAAADWHELLVSFSVDNPQQLVQELQQILGVPGFGD